MFNAAKGADEMVPLTFSANPTLDPTVQGSRTLVGWRFGATHAVHAGRAHTHGYGIGAGVVVHTVVVANAGAAAADLNIASLLQNQGSGRTSAGTGADGVHPDVTTGDGDAPDVTKGGDVIVECRYTARPLWPAILRLLTHILYWLHCWFFLSP